MTFSQDTNTADREESAQNGEESDYRFSSGRSR